MSETAIYSLAAVIIAGFIAFLTSAYTLRRQQPASEAEAENDRAAALAVYWKRIASLEEENEKLKQKLKQTERHYEDEIRKLKIENGKLWTEIGQLKTKMQ